MAARSWLQWLSKRVAPSLCVFTSNYLDHAGFAPQAQKRTTQALKRRITSLERLSALSHENVLNQ
jgi:hypothetical protein